MFDDVVRALRRDRPSLQARWIDIEDEAELVGEIDIETFPTFLVTRGTEVLFAGALTPQPEVLQRVLSQALESDAQPARFTDPAFGALARRLAIRTLPVNAVRR